MIDDLQKEIENRTEEFLEEKGIKPAFLPAIELRVDPRAIDPNFLGYSHISGGSEEELLDEADLEDFEDVDESDIYSDNSIEDSESAWNDVEALAGYFVPESARASAELVVNIRPFDLMEYGAGNRAYSKWVDEFIEDPVSEAASKLEEVGLQAGDTVEERIFHTVQREVEINGNKWRAIDEPVRDLYRQVLKNKTDGAVETCIHEAAHASFQENYDFKLPEFSQEEEKLILDHFNSSANFYRNFGSSVERWSKAIREVSGEQKAERYKDFVKIEGVNEVYARLVGKSWSRDISELGRQDLYQNVDFEEMEYEAHTPFGDGSAAPAELSKVKVEELRDYMVEEGFEAVLELPAEELIDKFYQND